MVQSAGTLLGGRYCVQSPIGAGATGEIYHVVDEQTGQAAALKLLRPELAADPETRARFVETAKLAARLDSAHVVRVVDVGEDELSASPFLVMELLSGESLLGRLERLGPVGAGELVHMARQVAGGLGYLHARGVVHRDVKPGNVWLLAPAPAVGSGVAVKLLDLGLAKVVARSGADASTTRNHGTPLYMAPEQLRGEGTIDARADRYALGHVVYHALVGQPYWQPELRKAPNLLRLVRLVSGELPETASRRALRLGVTLSPRFDRWFERAIAAKPERRHPSVETQIAELADALG